MTIRQKIADAIDRQDSAEALRLAELLSLRCGYSYAGIMEAVERAERLPCDFEALLYEGERNRDARV